MLSKKPVSVKKSEIPPEIAGLKRIQLENGEHIFIAPHRDPEQAQALYRIFHCP